jgi:serine acetyltransferase
MPTLGLRAILAADFARNRETLDRLTIAVFRFGQQTHRRPSLALLRPVSRLLNLLWLQLIIGAELPPALECGPGLRMPHAGRGVIVHPRTVIGSGATIYHRVTLGVTGDKGPPTLGDNVYIGTGATVMGDVAVGHGASIGAHAVVVRDVAPGATVVGVPAH